MSVCPPLINVIIFSFAIIIIKLYILLVPLQVFIGGWQTNLKVHCRHLMDQSVGRRFTGRKGKTTYIFTLISFTYPCIFQGIYQHFVSLANSPVSYFIFQLAFLTPFFIHHILCSVIKCFIVSSIAVEAKSNFLDKVTLFLRQCHSLR